MREQLMALSDSLEKFESTIADVEGKLSRRKAIPEHIVTRLSSYRNICSIQRRYISDICSQLALGDYEEVIRLSNLTNSLSTFVMEDARDILSSLLGDPAIADVVYN